MKVENVKNNEGRSIPNQFLIRDDEGNQFFQSYESIIAKIPAGHTGWKSEENNPKIELDAKTWDYSKTTGKYRNWFLNEKKADTEKKIKAGIYILKDLNGEM